MKGEASKLSLANMTPQNIDAYASIFAIITFTHIISPSS